MDLELLKRFYRVAEEGSLIKASKKVHVVPSALTKSISDFEDQQKMILFTRTRKGMRLTPQGERLHVFAKQLLGQVDSFERGFQEKEDEVEGEIKIITTPFAGSEWFVPHIPGFLDEYPKVRIKVLFKTDNLDPAEGDVAICPYRPHQPHLVQEPLFTTNVRLFASPDYLRKFGELEKPEDLDHHQLITYKGNYYSPHGSTNWALNVGRKNSTLPRESYFEIESLHGMFNSALQGLGITELPDYSTILKSGLVDVLPNLPGPKISMHYVFPERRSSSKKIKALLKYLKTKGK